MVTYYILAATELSHHPSSEAMVTYYILYIAVTACVIIIQITPAAAAMVKYYILAVTELSHHPSCC